jgi:hypothetical protein
MACMAVWRGKGSMAVLWCGVLEVWLKGLADSDGRHGGTCLVLLCFAGVCELQCCDHGRCTYCCLVGPAWKFMCFVSLLWS